MIWIISHLNRGKYYTALNNNGGWYDFGFVLGVGILFGGGSSASK